MDDLQLDQFKSYLTPRPKQFHKGEAGHILILGGDVGYSGAVRLAGEAALRVGAGLVSIVTNAKYATCLNVNCPELMVHTSKQLARLIEKVAVIILGPGLGQTTWSNDIFATVINHNKPMVVDADGLNLLAKKLLKKSNWILTPHPGEAARLLGKTSTIIQAERLASVTALQQITGGVVVLKGADSLVASEVRVSICKAGNPGMATAGMGDVLTGVIGGLLAQGVPLITAAELGVLLHAIAGDLAAKEGGERGLIASDLMRYLRKLVNIN